MRIDITLENNGLIPAGVNWTELRAGVQKNIDSFVEGTEGKITDTKRIAPPAGAQGEDQIVHWILEVLQDPKMAIVYYKLIVFGINELLTTAKEKTKSEEGTQKISSKLQILGKEIQLPTAVTAIEEFLKSLGE